MRPLLSLSLALAATAAMAPFAWAHFKLLEPASWIEENNLGDPQKLGPCGGTSANQAKGKAANPGTPTNMVTQAKGGQKLHIKLQETVFHPGHYRIALAVNSRAELPEDPMVMTRDSDKGVQSVSAHIERRPSLPSWWMDCGPIQPRWPIRGRPTLHCRTSLAQSARCRSSSSWPSMAGTRMAISRITTVRSCRSRPIHRSRSTGRGQPRNSSYRK